MGKINILPDNIVNLIAAGEVVERPASVVKELVENSIDAGATEILVKIKDGGTTQIEVIDNGSGMDAADALMAFAQHATSKIRSVEDLQNLISLGFRGEALASIGSVAKVSLDTKAEESEAVTVITERSETKQLDSAKSTNGTRITITKLFDSVPARKKFLRSPATELTHIQQTFIESALVHTDIHFELHHNNKLLYLLPKTPSFEERVFQIWNEQTSQKLYSAEAENEGIKVTAYLGSPDIARKDRKLQFIFVNGRPVSDRLIQRAVLDGYRGFIHRDLQPVYFIFLELNPDLVDVNVHPRKQEVRFREGQQVFGLVRNIVSSKLDTATKHDLLERISDNTPTVVEPIRPTQISSPTSPSPSSIPSSFSQQRPATKSVNQAMDFSRSILEESRYQEPEVVPVFQLFATYIVYQRGESIVFVDQHAAAEKILYEKLISTLDTGRSMPLLVPEVLEFGSEEKLAILASQSDLAELGLQVSDFGGNSIQVTSKPELTPKLDVKSLLEEFLEHAGEFGSDSVSVDKETPTQPAHHLIATMACHGSIRAGQSLSAPEMRQIVNDLEKCTRPYNCPHGRPVSWVMSRSELESNFKRII